MKLFFQLNESDECRPFEYRNPCVSGTHECPAHSTCSNYELSDGYTCNCDIGYFEVPVKTGLVRLRHLPYNGTTCAKYQTVHFKDYQMDYVISRHKMDYYG